MKIFLLFHFWSIVSTSTEVDSILKRLNKLENNQKMLIGTVRRQRGQIQNMESIISKVVLDRCRKYFNIWIVIKL